jgi:DNA repair exonuclease SbcCD ATPase subunit
MLVRTFALVVLMGVGSAAAWAFSPGLRTQIAALWDSHMGWTEAARQADPAGFASHAEAKLQQDLTKMDATRRELTAEVGRLSKTAREQSALAEQARRLAEQFRDVYQTAQADGRFPVEVRGAAYTESQVHSQVSMLLAEAEGYEASLADLEAVRTTAEAKIEELAVRINRTEAQLASLATKRELLRARQLTAAGEELLAQVDELMTGNRQTIDANPAATVRELLARTPAKQEGRATDRKVAEFLTAEPAKPEAVETTVELFDTSVTEPTTQQSPAQFDSKDKPRTGKQSKPARTKPIFQQS